MNIFEEIAKNYTYNGEVSLKALDDDIVTLENQIENYESTSRELTIRRKSTARIAEKIRDAKIKLSLLKAVYKKESEKNVSDSAILNILGVSGKEAAETVVPETAASGKSPLKQNFETAELDRVVDKQVNAGVSKPEKEEVINNEAVTAENTDNETIIVDENASDEELKELYASLTSDDMIIVRNPVREPKIEAGKQETEFRTGIIGAAENNTDSKLVKTETGKDNVKPKIFKLEAIKKIPETRPSKTEKAQVEKENVATNHESVQEIQTEIAPPPTIDDYMEPELNKAHVEYTYDEDGCPVQVDVSNTDLPEYEVTVSNDQKDMDKEVTVKEDEVEYDESKAYDAFYSYDNKIYASFDLCLYTDMVNTNSVSGFFNPKYKTIELTFTDARDYPLLLFFLNEKNDKCSFFKRILRYFGKNQRSIIMYVRTELDGVKKEYRYEFTGCRLVSVFDSEYKSMRDSTYYGTSTHEFFTKFKYKKFKVV